MRHLLAAVRVHIEGTRHGPVQVGQCHHHVAVPRPDVQAVRDQAAVLGKQDLLVRVREASGRLIDRFEMA